MAITAPINLKEWVEENRDLLKPPVGNKCVYEDSQSFIMVVGGPNLRKDYHVNVMEEFFYQIEGDIVLKTVQEGKIIPIPIKEGEIFLLPPNIPHSPQRPTNSVGLVLERKRPSGKLDGFKWFCEECTTVLYEEELQVTNIVKQLPPVFDRFYAKKENQKCKKCDWEMQVPAR